MNSPFPHRAAERPRSSLAKCQPLAGCATAVRIPSDDNDTFGAYLYYKAMHRSRGSPANPRPTPFCWICIRTDTYTRPAAGGPRNPINSPSGHIGRTHLRPRQPRLPPFMLWAVLSALQIPKVEAATTQATFKSAMQRAVVASALGTKPHGIPVSHRNRISCCSLSLPSLRSESLGHDGGLRFSCNAFCGCCDQHMPRLTCWLRDHEPQQR